MSSQATRRHRHGLREHGRRDHRRPFAAGAKGIVVAGVGNGNMTEEGLKALAAQSKKGIVCVRSTRVATGRVGRNVEVDDDKLGLIASDDLNPQKARVLLRLALLKPRSPADMQRLFVEY